MNVDAPPPRPKAQTRTSLTRLIGAVRAAAAKAVALVRRDRLERDFEQELASHLEMAAEDHRRRGLSAEQARRQAVLTLGGVEATRLLHRDTRGVPHMDVFLHDLRYTFRTLRRDMGFSLIAILILAIGIGANTAIFSLVNALLFRPLPFPNADRLVYIENSGGLPKEGTGGPGDTLAPPAGDSDAGGLSGRTTRAFNLAAWQQGGKSFEEMGAYFAFYSYLSAKLTIGDETERLVDVMVTCRFYDTLGVQPAIGRLFVQEECVNKGPKAVLMSHRLWERRFNSDRSLVGRAITLNNEPVTVVGVMPEAFDFGSVFAPGTRADLWTPFAIDEEHDQWGNTLAVVGRLKPGVTVQAAQIELNAVTRAMHRERKDRGNGWGPRVAALQTHVSGRLRTALFLLFTAVGAVLLIACANLSNLLLARAASRQPEIAVRTALGATRGRLIRQLLTESLVLSLCGAALGLLLAVFATRGVTHLQGFSLPLLQTVEVDGTALAFTVGIAILTGVIFGLVPALQMSAARPVDALKQQSRGASGGARAAWMRRTLVVSEIALAFVLLVTAGLLIRSFARVLDVNLGFQPERVAVLRVEPSGPTVVDDRPKYVFYTDIIRRVKEIPGVEAAAVTDALPLDRNRTWGIAARGQLREQGRNHSMFVRVISAGYFATMKIPIKQGEDFPMQVNAANKERLVIINETTARTLWPNDNPIGRYAIIQGNDHRVIGVVADVRHTSLEESSGIEAYLPITQYGPAGSADLVMRTAMQPSALAASLRGAVRAVDPGLPTADVRIMQDLVDKAVSPRRFIMWLLTAFAVQALVLACLGIYGVVSYSVTERTREIGIRMALGASRGDVQRRVLRETLALAAVGAVLGLIGAFAAARIITSLLFGLSSTDPATFGGMIAILSAVALIAGYIPARRASRIDAMTALRSS